MIMAEPKVVLELAGREVAVSNPSKVFFPRAGVTKLDMVRYYLAVADGALGGVGGRPMALKRFVNGAESEPFFQKRAPEKRPDWIETVELRFPSGRTADEVVVSDEAALAWVVNLGCIDLNPHPVRVSDLDHPDELRVDLDPVPGVEWPQIREVALVAAGVLADFGLTGWPKTSGSRGMHIYARIEPRWSFGDVRRAAVAVAREIERRAPDLATSKWWKEERHGVFVDYNQNAKDRTVASAYSIRPVPDARVSAPLTWDEVPTCDPASFTIDTVPARFAALGDPVGGHGRGGRVAGRAARAGGQGRGGGPARRAVAAALREAGRGGAPGAAVQAPGAWRGSGAPPRSPAAAGLARPCAEPDRAAAQHEAADRDRPGARPRTRRWRAWSAGRHAIPAVWPLLEPRDVLVDAMRGRSSLWYRIRVNLQHVPEAERPPQEPLEVDYDPWAGFSP